MMKRKYLHPNIAIVNSSSKEMLLSSRGVTGDNGIGYGGVDDGSHDPASKESDTQDIWEDDVVIQKNNLWDE